MDWQSLLVTVGLWAFWASIVTAFVLVLVGSFLFIVWACCRIVGCVLKTLFRWTFED